MVVRLILHACHLALTQVFVINYILIFQDFELFNNRIFESEFIGFRKRQNTSYRT